MYVGAHYRNDDSDLLYSAQMQARNPAIYPSERAIVSPYIGSKFHDLQRPAPSVPFRERFFLIFYRVAHCVGITVR